MRCLLPEFVLVAELNRGRGSGGVWKRPAVVGGPGPLTGRVSTGIPRGATSGSAPSTIAAFRGEIISSTGASSAAFGSLTGSDVSITEGGPARERRDRLSRTLSEAEEELGGLGMSTSGRRNRIRTGT